MARIFNRLSLRLKYFLSNAVNHRQAADTWLVGSVWAMVAFGLVMLSSATAVISYTKFNYSYYFLTEQFISVIIGAVAFFVFSKINYHNWGKWGLTFLVVSCVLLLLVFIPGVGKDYGKALSWVSIFGFSFQPSELVKLSFIIYLAAWIAHRKTQLKDFHTGTAPFMIVLGIISFLMLLQPDLGTLLIIASVSMIMYFVGGGSAKHLALIFLAGLIAVFALTQINDYQTDRFRCWADPMFDPADRCYQVDQSLIAVGSGGLWGRGLGASRQKFLYLPEVSGDFVFAIVGEETGLVISVLVIGLFFFIFYRGFLVSQNAPDDFGKYLALGISAWLIMQAIINIGGVINFMPMTGVPLPFISHGGTAIIAILSAMGILANISRYAKQ